MPRTNDKKQEQFNKYVVKNDLSIYNFFCHSGMEYLYIYKKPVNPDAWSSLNQISCLPTLINRIKAAKKVEYYETDNRRKIDFEGFEGFKTHILIEKLSGLV